MNLDPITLALIQNRLDYITHQMGWVMIRTARSPIFSQAHDFSCFITDFEGTLISQADGIPIHTGGGGFAIRALLKSMDGKINADERYLLNDPYVAGGNHLPDWVIAHPVFADNRLIAFTCIRAHQSDIGGGAAGTYNPNATEIYQEGLRIPPMRLVENGEIREDLWQLLMINTRCPDLLDGDLRAMLGATQIGAEQVKDLASRMGVQKTQSYFSGILDYADRSMKLAISELPDGSYESEEYYDTDCFTEVKVRFYVRLTIQGDKMTVDFTGTDPQIKGFKNSSLANTYSAVYAAVASFFESGISRNEGTFRNVQIIAPPGTVINANPPAPMTQCTVFPAHEIIHMCWWALGQARPKLNCAGWGKNSFPVSSGTHDSGKTWILYQWPGLSGAGAVYGRDGFNQLGPLITLGGLTLPNAEIYEQLYPVQIQKQEFRCDGGGAGEFRGGTGVDYEVEMKTPCQMSFRGEGLRRSTGIGVEGGFDGAVGRLSITETAGLEKEPPQYALWQLQPLFMKMSSPGGGGYGNPLKRIEDLVKRDVKDGVVSRKAAKELYGVVLDGEYNIDFDATAMLRKAL